MAQTMPEVWNLSAEQAKSVLTYRGVPFRVVLQHSTNIEEGRLISVAPRPGTPLGPGDEAILTVSSGPPQVAAQLPWVSRTC